MSCDALQHRCPEAFSKNDELLSWSTIAAAVRNHSRSLAGHEAEELLDFADLLDGFAELER
jgi:hypothetical protein